ncbi:MAG: hypothetical protein ACI9RU_000445 [Litorivivens sp.]|jgi:hypothetical protein
MKHIYFLLAAACLSTAAVAQSVESTEAWETDISVSFEENEHEYSRYMTNVGDSEVNLRLTAHVQSIVDGAEYRFCWGPSCFLWGTEDYTSPDSEQWIVNIQPGAVDTTFYTDYRHNSNYGISTIDYCWWDVNNPNEENCYTLNWSLLIDDVRAIENPEFELTGMSPNPVAGTSAFQYELSGTSNNVQVVFYNLMGEKVRESKLNGSNGVVFVQASDFESGVYFYSLMVDGKVLSTKKMIVSK